jgi:hypothetical protein
MFQKTHQGKVKNTVVLEFENGYTITLEKGVEMCMSLVMDEKQIEKLKEHKCEFGEGFNCLVCGKPVF